VTAPDAGAPAEKRAEARVLLVDDDHNLAAVIAREMGRAGFAVTSVSNGEAAIAEGTREDFDAILLDLRLGGRDGLEVLQALREKGVTSEVIVLTGHGTIESAIKAMRAGAREYLTKPCKLSELEVHLRRAVEDRRLREEHHRLKEYLAGSEAVRPIVTRSPGMLRLLESLPRVAQTDVPVLIQGESGTGKELIAREIHRLSRLRAQPFLAVNCAVLKTEILESELFGHERGAFTGATRRKPGLFEIASGGTLFLDEVGEIEERIQAKLLRVLQFGEIRRVGGTEAIQVQVRIVAATNKVLDAEVEKGLFRQDLLFRLNVVTLEVPPLRTRSEDLELLFHHFITMYRGGSARRLSPEALDLLKRYPWPGNVRELENVVRRLLIFHDQETIDGAIIQAVLPRAVGRDNESILTLAEVERRHVLKVLTEQGYDKRRASEILGISLKTLYNKLHQYGAMGRESRGADQDLGPSGANSSDGSP
jgi:DNA-binding NtrC family response regulator